MSRDPSLAEPHGARHAYGERAELLLPQVNGNHDLAGEAIRLGKRYPNDVRERIENGKSRACVSILMRGR